jgi:hypothetical protein
MLFVTPYGRDEKKKYHIFFMAVAAAPSPRLHYEILRSFC